jgi:hypothetical protein
VLIAIIISARETVQDFDMLRRMADEELIRELQHLRTAGGLTVAKIEASPLLLKALRTQSPEEAMEAFKQQLDKLSDDDERVLSNAFNLSGRGLATQFERRAGYAAEFNTVDSVVERWEDIAMRNLASLMGS